MKKITLSLIALLTNMFVFSQTLTPLNSGTPNFLLSVSAPSSCIAYVSGENGTIIKTTNGGATWTSQTSNTTEDLYPIQFINTDTGYVAGNNGTALMTTNGGTTWTPMNLLGSTDAFRNINFINADTGYITGGASGSYGSIYKTTDGGATWTQLTIGASNVIYNVFFTSPLIGYAPDYSGVMWKTTDGGTTWTALNPGIAGNIGGAPVVNSPGHVTFTNANDGIFDNGLGTILQTTNAGATWSTVATYNSPTEDLGNIDFYNGNNGIIAGGNIAANTGFILTTNNGGTTWTSIPLPAGTQRLGTSVFLNQNTGYVLGSGGTILKFGVSVSSNPVASATTSMICLGSSVTLTYTGATTYIWSPATGLNTITGATVIAKPTVTTTYTVIGTTSCGNDTALYTVTVNQPPVLTLNPDTTICIGTSATLTANGATTYHWSPAIGLNTATGATVIATPAVTTTYTVMGTTACGNKTTSVTITVNQVSTHLNTSSDIICAGMSATLTAGGATTYSWFPSTGLNTTTGATVIATPAETTTYMVKGTDGSGCNDSSIVTVTVNPVAVSKSLLSDSMCIGTSVELISTGLTNYIWSPAAGLNTTTGDTVIATPVVSTTYTVIGISTSTCQTDTSLFALTVYPITVFVSVNSDSICLGESAILNANGATTYLWSTGSTLDSITISPAKTTSYTVTGTNGCSNQAVGTVTILPDPTANFFIFPQRTTILNPLITIADTSVGASLWNWNFGDSTSLTSNVSGILTHSYTDTGTYAIQLITVNKYGCMDTSYQTVFIDPPLYFYIPDAFTPNGDGKNDTFNAKGEGFTTFEMQIFDRWGSLIFCSNDVNTPWDGKANGGAQVAQIDTYVYVFQITDLDKHDHTYRGTVTLLK